MANSMQDQLNEMKSKSKISSANWIKVGLSTCGIAAGADAAFQTLKQEAQKHNLDIRVERTGCAGMCFAEPLVEVCVEGMPRIVYGQVDKETAVKIITDHVLGKEIINDHVFKIK